MAALPMRPVRPHRSSGRSDAARRGCLEASSGTPQGDPQLPVLEREWKLHQSGSRRFRPFRVPVYLRQVHHGPRRLLAGLLPLGRLLSRTLPEGRGPSSLDAGRGSSMKNGTFRGSPASHVFHAGALNRLAFNGWRLSCPPVKRRSSSALPRRGLPSPRPIRAPTPERRSTRRA